MTIFHLTTSHFDSKLFPVISYDLKDENRSLLVCYDLNNCLANLGPKIDRYVEILDIYLLETILYLGKYHQRYFKSGDEIPAYGLKKYFLEFLADDLFEVNGESGIPVNFWPRLLAYAKSLKKNVMAAGTWHHYQEVELPFSIALHELTSDGVTLDFAALKKIRKKAELAFQKIYYALDVNNVSGAEIKDLNDWIRGYDFDELIPPGRDDVSMKDLPLLENQHQVFKIFSRLDKLKRINNFLNSIGNQSKIRPFYKTMGAVTGRCTSTNPNIMGIPKIFRQIVVPSKPDSGIVECDYSQMEVGVAAALSSDQNLIDDFNSTDVYEKTGELLFGHLGGGSRSKAKIIFLGIQYGLSRKTIARLLELSEGVTSRILNRLYGRYSSLSGYLAWLEKSGQANGFVKSISGLRRYRRFSDTDPNYWEKNWFKNFPIQSSAASIFKKAIIEMCHVLSKEPFNLLVPLYDSVVFECPLKRIEEITGIVVDCMIRSMKAYFPKLKPKVSVNNSDTSCWNSEGKNNSIDKFLENPLFDIDIKKKPSSNVNWAEYL